MSVVLLHPDCDPPRDPLGAGALFLGRPSAWRMDPELVGAIPQHLAERYQIVPLAIEGDVLKLGMVDPDNGLAIDDIRLITGYDVQPVPMPAEALREVAQSVADGNLVLQGVRAHLQQLRARVHLTGPAAHVELEATFQVDLPGPVSAVYALPVLEGGMVHRFSVTVDGELREAAMAAGTPQGPRVVHGYEWRNDVFAAELSGVGQRVCVSLSYAQRLTVMDGDLVFHLPLGSVAAATVEVVVDGPVPARLACSLPLPLEPQEDGRLTGRLDLAGPPLRDLVIRFRAGAGQPLPVLWSDAEALLCTLFPPHPPGPPAMPRDVVVVVDCTARPGGGRQQAILEAVSRMLRCLRPVDRFRLLAFRPSLDAYAGGLLCSGNVWSQATAWLREVELQASHHFNSLLQDLLSMPGAPGRTTSVFLISDRSPAHGPACGPPEGGLPFHVFAVEQDVNPGLRMLARRTRGSYTEVPWVRHLPATVVRVLQETAAPLLSDLVTSKGVELDAPLPHLTQSCPSVAFGRWDTPGPVTLQGVSPAGDPWEAEVQPRPTGNPALRVLAAASALERETGAVVAEPQRLVGYKQAMVAHSMEAGVVCPYTRWTLPGGRIAHPGTASRTNAGEEVVTELGLIHQPPILRVVDLILGQALKDGASHVHLEPNGGQPRVLFRVDGTLHHVMDPPRHVHLPVLRRLKLLAGVHLHVDYRPQSGVVTFRHEDRDVVLDADFVPTLGGEAAVLAVRHRQVACPAFAELTQPHLERVTFETLQAGPGLVLVVGPRDTALRLGYACTRWASPERRVVTLERDPALRLKGVSQVQLFGRIEDYLPAVDAQDADMRVGPCAAHRRRLVRPGGVGLPLPGGGGGRRARRGQLVDRPRGRGSRRPSGAPRRAGGRALLRSLRAVPGGLGAPRRYALGCGTSVRHHPLSGSGLHPVPPDGARAPRGVERDAGAGGPVRRGRMACPAVGRGARSDEAGGGPHRLADLSFETGPVPPLKQPVDGVAGRSQTGLPIALHADVGAVAERLHAQFEEGLPLVGTVSNPVGLKGDVRVGQEIQIVAPGRGLFDNPGVARIEQEAAPQAGRQHVGIADEELVGPAGQRILGGHLAAGDAAHVLQADLAVLALEQRAGVLRHQDGVVAVGEVLGQRGLAGRLGADQADPEGIPGPHRRWQPGPGAEGVPPHPGGRDRDDASSDIDRHELGAQFRGQPDAVLLGCEHQVRTVGQAVQQRSAPEIPEVRRLGRVLRQHPVEMDDAGRSGQLLHPTVAQQAGDGLGGQRADDHGEVVAGVPGELHQVEMAQVGRHELAQHHAPGHARMAFT